MKRIALALLALLLCLPLAGCQGPGRTNNADIRYGTSSRFSQAEIKSAVDVVLVKFRDFVGCDLKAIWYDESVSDSLVDVYLTNGGGATKSVARGDVIVLLSDFYVDASGGDGSFNANSTYTGWSWTIIRDSAQGPWRVADWGY